MSLSFRGPGGVMELRWVAYALLRDNLLHHKEGGKATDAFASTYAISGALSGETVKVDAVAFRRELEAARPILELPIDQLAVSLRTRAMLSLSWPLPSHAVETALAKDSGFSVPSVTPDAKTLDDVIGYVVRGLLDVTKGAKESDVVDVVDL